MSHGHVISFEGKQYRFPDDATDQEISEQLASISNENRQMAPSISESGSPAMEHMFDQPWKISAPEPGVGPWINRQKNRLVQAMSGGGKPDAAVQLVGGPVIGPMTAAHGVTQLPEHPIKGANEIVRGGAQTVALPMAATNPAFMADALPYAAIGTGVNKTAEYMGADPDTSELLGNLAAAGYGARRPITRTAGELLKTISKAPDLPTDIPMSPKTNALTSIINAGKNKVGGLGRRMANVGIPDAPNIVPDSSVRPGGPEPVDSTVRPDAQEHYNDIVPGSGPAPTQQQGKGRIPIWQQAGELQSHIDAAVDQAPISAPTESAAPPSTTTPTTTNPLIQSMHSSYAEVPPEPTGWPENGRENEPWDSILDREQPQQQTPKGLLPPASDLITSYHGAPSSRVKSIIRQGIKPGADLPRDSGGSQHDVAFSTDNPYAARDFGERYPDSEEPPIKTGVFELHSPSNMMADKSEVEGMDFSPVTEYRRSGGFPKSEIKGLTTHIAPLYHDPIYLPESSLLNDVVNNDPYNRVDEIQSQRPKRRLTDKTGPLGDEGKGGDIGDGDVNSTVVGSQSGADSDTQAFAQARSELPNGTLSDHLLRAQEIKTKGQGQGQGQGQYEPPEGASASTRGPRPPELKLPDMSRRGFLGVLGKTAAAAVVPDALSGAAEAVSGKQVPAGATVDQLGALQRLGGQYGGVHLPSHGTYDPSIGDYIPTPIGQILSAVHDIGKSKGPRISLADMITQAYGRIPGQPGKTGYYDIKPGDPYPSGRNAFIDSRLKPEVHPITRPMKGEMNLLSPEDIQGHVDNIMSNLPDDWNVHFASEKMPDATTTLSHLRSVYGRDKIDTALRAQIQDAVTREASRGYQNSTWDQAHKLDDIIKSQFPKPATSKVDYWKDLAENARDKAKMWQESADKHMVNMNRAAGRAGIQVPEPDQPLPPGLRADMNTWDEWQGSKERLDDLNEDQSLLQQIRKRTGVHQR